MKENKFEEDITLLSYGIKEWILNKAKAIDYTTIHCFNFDKQEKLRTLLLKIY